MVLRMTKHNFSEPINISLIGSSLSCFANRQPHRPERPRNVNVQSRRRLTSIAMIRRYLRIWIIIIIPASVSAYWDWLYRGRIHNSFCDDNAHIRRRRVSLAERKNTTLISFFFHVCCVHVFVIRFFSSIETLFLVRNWYWHSNPGSVCKRRIAK